MYEFTPFKKTDKLSFKSFIQFPRDRLDLSFKQIKSNKKIQFYDAKGDMYVIFKRDEIQKKLHIKRYALDTAISQLKECNLIKEKKQGKNMSNIIYLGKTIGMIESEKIEKFRSVEISSQESMKTTLTSV